MALCIFQDDPDNPKFKANDQQEENSLQSKDRRIHQESHYYSYDCIEISKIIKGSYLEISGSRSRTWSSGIIPYIHV